MRVYLPPPRGVPLGAGVTGPYAKACVSLDGTHRTYGTCTTYDWQEGMRERGDGLRVSAVSRALQFRTPHSEIRITRAYCPGAGGNEGGAPESPPGPGGNEGAPWSPELGAAPEPEGSMASRYFTRIGVSSALREGIFDLV